MTRDAMSRTTAPTPTARPHHAPCRTERTRRIGSLTASGAFLVLLLALLWTLPVDAAPPAALGGGATRSLPLKIVPRGVDEVHLEPADPEEPAAGYRYVVEYADGRTERLTPDAFAELLYTEYYGRTRLFALLNITSPVGVAWVALGLLGQVLFTGRMLVQWLASERKRRSVVPTAFWWMSLGGATMLIIYFVWRKDIVGVLGQATGWLIYVRNLRLIYRSPADDEAAPAR